MTREEIKEVSPKAGELQKKISIIVPLETYQRLYDLFEWGERNRVMVRLIDWMCDKIEKHGQRALMVLLRDDEIDKLLKMRAQSDGDD